VIRRASYQGWAIVDNVNAADWDDVELSLVAGAPQTFKQPLSMPLFVTRPTVPLMTTSGLVPQTHAGAMSTGAGSGSGLGPGGGGGTGGGAYMSASGETAAMTAGRRTLPRSHPPPAAANPAWDSEAIASRSLEQPMAASAADLGELFEYRLNDRVTIKRNQSALVPILQAPVAAERISLWTPRQALVHAARCGSPTRAPRSSPATQLDTQETRLAALKRELAGFTNGTRAPNASSAS
jgi:hypothetical protein